MRLISWSMRRAVCSLSVLVLREVPAKEARRCLLAEGERSHRLAHAPLAHHAACEIGCALEVVAGARRDAKGGDLFRDTATHQHRDLIVEILLRVMVLLVDRQLLRQP